ncbi:MAG TPA: polyphenol oxidase family protein [Acidimicrobiales bacterium]|nr:polyphenol oxidase family protein [Acidimicrobiales bacterium]
MTEPGEHAGVEADAAITRVPLAKLAIRTADCVPLVLEGEDAIGVVHAGWRGLAAGIVQHTIEALGPVRRVHVGPHIRYGCYEFGEADLDEVAAALGDVVRSTTAWGKPALDLTAGVRSVLGDLRVGDTGACTACSNLYYSWRARKDTARFATIAWMS